MAKAAPITRMSIVARDARRAVEHIGRFNLRSDSARELLHDADKHIASVSVPYALAPHEEFVMKTLDLLTAEGKMLRLDGNRAARIRAWNMHAVLFETCGSAEPKDWMQTFHVLREVRNCIIHAGGRRAPTWRAGSPIWTPLPAKAGSS